MKNLCSGTQCGGFQFLLILDLWGISFHAVIVFGLGKNLLFKSVLGHCASESRVRVKISPDADIRKKGLGAMGFPCTKNVLEQNQDNSRFLDSKRLHTD